MSVLDDMDHEAKLLANAAMFGNELSNERLKNIQLTKEITRLRADLAEAERHCRALSKELDDSSEFKGRLRTRAERAEADLAEAERERDEAYRALAPLDDICRFLGIEDREDITPLQVICDLNDKYNAETARAERAEAALAEARALIEFYADPAHWQSGS